jgi:hypothetical protein
LTHRSTGINSTAYSVAAVRSERIEGFPYILVDVQLSCDEEVGLFESVHELV